MSSPSLNLQRLVRAYEMAGTSTDDVVALAARLGVDGHLFTRRTDLLNGRVVIVHRHQLPEPSFAEESAVWTTN